MPTERIEGKRVLVTGGTTGIGRETVKLLASAGARLLTFGRHAPELADALGYAGLPGEAGLVADAATPEGIETVYAALDERLGGIDVLVACAGLGAQPIFEMAGDDWRYVVETNLMAYMACAREAIRRMEGEGGGHLLFVGSISPRINAPGESVYAATKGGVASFAETLRKEVAEKNIRVTLIEPGSVDTDMQQCSEEEKREAVAREAMLHASDIAEGIVFALTRPQRCDVLVMRIEPRLQKTA
jgi:NAD(P)-dependent dehydrogenase (short-subunit alcohol dehydrogenase family)